MSLTSNWQNILLSVEIIVSIGLIIFSLINLNRFDELRKSKTSTRWLNLLCLVLVLSYLYYAFYVLKTDFEFSKFVISSALLVAAFIIWTITNLTNSVAADLTKAAAVEHYRATHDDLTGLPNLSFFNEQLGINS